MRWLVAAALLVAGCTPGGGSTLTVFAAASLTEPFGALVERFESEHPGVEVRLVLGGSSRLAAQLREGARADVFAPADEVTMNGLAGAGLVDRAAVRTFATNRLTIAVEPGNPRGITGLDDLARDDLAVVMCARQVPCGAAAARLADLAGVRPVPDSEELDVKSVLHKVRVGEADAGLVYASDVVAARGEVEAVDVARADDAVNTYPIAVLQDAANDRLARQFADLVRSEDGRRTLAAAGFGAPS